MAKKTSQAEASVLAVDDHVDEGLLRRLRGICTHSPPVRMELHHAGSGAGTSMVMHWQGEVVQKLLSQGSDMVAREVWMQAKDAVAVYTGPQKMILLSWSEGLKSPISTPFLALGGAWIPDGEDDPYSFGKGFDGESVSYKGTIGQILRWAGESQKLAVHGAAKMLDTQQRALDRYAEQQGELFKAFIEIRTTLEDLKDKQWDRDQSRQDKEEMRTLKKELFGLVKDQLPSVMMRFSPAGGTALEGMLAQYLQMFDKEKLEMFLSIQTPEQREMFNQLVALLMVRQGGPPQKP